MSVPPATHPALPPPSPGRETATQGRVLAAMVLLCLLAGLWAVVASTWPDTGAPVPAPHADAPGVQRLGQAEFSLEGGTVAAVTLPDAWVRRGLPYVGAGVYRLRVHLDQAPEGLQALRIDRFSTLHRVRVNGVVLSEQGPQDPQARRGRLFAHLIAVPAAVLHAGDNLIEIELRRGSVAGLDAVRLGPDASMRAPFERHVALTRQLPQALNVAFFALAVFMALIWWQRRSEHAIGLFGVLSLLLALRNYSYYLDSDWIGSAASDWAYYAVQCATTSVLGLFAIAMSRGQAWPRLRRLYLVTGIGFPLLAALTMQSSLFAPLRQATYALEFALAVVGLILLFPSFRRLSGAALASVSLGFVVMVLAALHDYLLLLAQFPRFQHYWTPYAYPFVLGNLAGLLIRRLVGALGQAEALRGGLEARVKERTLALAQANEAKSRFLAAASHDLRQPVAAIGLMAGLAREQSESPAQRRLMDQLSQAVSSMETLLRGLLDLSRLEGQQGPARLQTVCLQTLFNAVADHLQWSARERGLQLRLRPTGLQVRSDPVLLEQMLRNLVANALRYTAHGGVLVGARVRGSTVRLQVWDTGPGIAPEHQAQVFEEFVQLDNPARLRERGLGLGLAIVRRAATTLQHELTLRSVPGRGSCFSLSLPLAGRSTQAFTDDAASAGPVLAGRHVLLIEDDPLLREALTARLQAWSARVQAWDGHDFQPVIQAAATQPFDLILCDWRLPAGDGTGLVEGLRRTARRAHGRALPALVISGDVSPEVTASLQDAGVAFLRKPFSAAALRSGLQLLLAAQTPTPPATAPLRPAP
jgi:signal transduction histidine kinase/CheY-like chemotaxis protein